MSCDMLRDVLRAARFSRWYATASVLIALLVYVGIPGAVGVGIAGIAALQGLAYAFVTSFWARYEAFAGNQDWAAADLESGQTAHKAESQRGGA